MIYILGDQEDQISLSEVCPTCRIHRFYGNSAFDWSWGILLRIFSNVMMIEIWLHLSSILLLATEFLPKIFEVNPSNFVTFDSSLLVFNEFLETTTTIDTDFHIKVIFIYKVKKIDLYNTVRTDLSHNDRFRTLLLTWCTTFFYHNF